MSSPVTAKPRTSFAYAMLAVLFLSPLVPVARALLPGHRSSGSLESAEHTEFGKRSEAMAGWWGG